MAAFAGPAAADRYAGIVAPPFQAPPGPVIPMDPAPAPGDKRQHARLSNGKVRLRVIGAPSRAALLAGKPTSPEGDVVFW